MTPKGKIIFALYLFFSHTCFGQIINPSFSKRDINYCDIKKIERSSYFTTIYFKYTAPSTYLNGGWVCANSNFFIRDSNTKSTYKLIRANNIPICPSKHNFQYQDQTLEFIIVFEALPSTTSKIDIIEYDNNVGLNFYGVDVMPSNNITKKSRILKSEARMWESYHPPSNTLYILSAGTHVNILGLDKGYYEVEYNGKIGYIDEMYFQYSGITNKTSTPSKSQNNSTTIKNETKILKSEAKMRETSSPLSNTLFILPAGTYVKVLGLEEGYYEVKYKEKIGYISKFYFEYSDKTNETSKPSKSQNNSTTIKWNENSLKEHWKTNGLDKIEGIYEAPSSYTDVNVACLNRYGQTVCYSTWRHYDVKYKVALIKTEGDYKLLYLSGNLKGSEKVGGCNCDGESYIAPENNKWIAGEVKAQLYKTATHGFYKCDWFMNDKSLNSDGYISFDNPSYFKLFLSGKESLFLKLYPTADENIGHNNNNTERSSGTGFAISSNGYIATNHHVTNGAFSIKVRGINGDFTKSYTAKVIVEDKNNDISIIKIDDPSFTSIGTIPYVISRRASDVGSSVFVLGYPLRTTMGDEVKLTNGIISSKSGFQGDVTSYQITAPVQPGNSGGPLFDDKGNIIGIINAKHGGAENASYAIKASYLINLIEIMPSAPKLQTISTVASKPLTEQTKILKKFTYIIEIN
jgi:S1-C subfamily serine protease